ncbi:MAG TPA: 2-aminomuconate deaminase [Cryomorphaceae bacterium]|jgi:2-aminomuconate deaminase|nr:MAG: 2-aminomuconate deaminase [Cryomorphaceae bacterium BACL7 MAG-120910-bin2]KRO69171.1 MAG: 2-aminomuconate deaminase [Cryomorphaceae bacterium BACL7 MAG-120322-bin74]KRO83884.1 MAG: 2-aminomuconate deaminase [Cryomorphaceae bacterium BACL7 MAG-121220-bin83]NQW24958.1 RidA family protein [Cryomorphaceae bacterium]HAB31726.1 2-aminomuconate deaminase [Cryomorphaceae bacterium]
MQTPSPTPESNAPLPVGAYPMTRRVGDLLFLSGVGPRKPKSDTAAASVPGLVLNEKGAVMDYDFELQVHSVMANVKTILEEAGARWDQLVDITVYLTDMERDFGTFNRLYAAYMEGVEPKPCRTTLEVLSLPTPIAIELKCIAAL